MCFGLILWKDLTEFWFLLCQTSFLLVLPGPLLELLPEIVAGYAAVCNILSDLGRPVKGYSDISWTEFSRIGNLCVLLFIYHIGRYIWLHILAISVRIPWDSKLCHKGLWLFQSLQVFSLLCLWVKAGIARKYLCRRINLSVASDQVIPLLSFVRYGFYAVFSLGPDCCSD